MNVARNLWKDEGGFIVSAELVLVATILVIGMIVGLSEVQHAVVQELNDVACAIASLNQSFSFTGFVSKDRRHEKSFTRGSFFVDTRDVCDCNQCEIACDPPQPEDPRHGGGGRP